jgi:hypothetical protein
MDIPLAYAVANPQTIAEKRSLTEATETITVFAAMCIWPEHFAVLAYGFAGLCVITTEMRVWWGF